MPSTAEYLVHTLFDLCVSYHRNPASAEFTITSSTPEYHMWTLTIPLLHVSVYSCNSCPYLSAAQLAWIKTVPPGAFLFVDPHRAELPHAQVCKSAVSDQRQALVESKVYRTVTVHLLQYP